MKLLDKWHDAQTESWLVVGDIVRDFLPIDLLEELELMNDHETIYQNINRYINDRSSEMLSKRISIGVVEL